MNQITQNHEMAVVLAECILKCNHCFDSCLREEDVKMMAECIRTDKECAEICSATLLLINSKTGSEGKMLEICADICEKCARECEKFHHDHCRQCAEACRKCAEACRSTSM